MNMAAASGTSSSSNLLVLVPILLQAPSRPNISSLHFSFSRTPTTTPPPSLSITAISENTKRKSSKKKMMMVKSSESGLYSADQFELTPENVDMVLQEVRPYLIADGGNVDVVSVESGIVCLKLQGACGSCPSSTTTMKLGIERVLKEKFGDAMKEICQVYDDEQLNDTTVSTVEAVDSHLDILRPAIKNYGGSAQVVSVKEGNCFVKYVGPESIGLGIKAAIKEKFSDITNVVLLTHATTTTE